MSDYGTVAGVASYVKRLTNVAGMFSDGNASTLTTTLPTPNSNLTYTAHQVAADADGISIRYVVPLAPAPLAVSVAGRAITVALAFDGVDVTSTANDVRAALIAHPSVAALVDVVLAPGEDGTGVVSAMPVTYLQGGVTPTGPTLTEVERFLDQASNHLNGWLAAAGYVIPVTNPRAREVLDRFAEWGGAGFAELSQRAGGYNANDENRRENKFLDDFFTQAPIYIKSGALAMLGAATQANTAPPPLSGFRVGGTTRSGAGVRPMFSRRSFGWNPTAETPRDDE